jgi:hypothetical protein
LATVILVSAQQAFGLLFVQTRYSGKFSELYSRMEIVAMRSGPWFWVWRGLMTALSHSIVIVLNAVLLTYPNTMLSRVMASCLPVSDKPIVPMDRTFGVTSRSNGDPNPQPLSVLDAWRSIDRDTYIRIVKLFVKAQLLKGLFRAVYMVVMAVLISVVIDDNAWYFLLKDHLGMYWKFEDLSYARGTMRHLVVKCARLQVIQLDLMALMADRDTVEGFPETVRALM